jgi:aminobenzoyl-glutamate transport protein
MPMESVRQAPAAPPPAGPPAAPERRTLLRVLDAVERWGNLLPDPVTLFALLALGAVLASWLTSVAGVTVIHPRTLETVAPVNLLTAEQIRRMFAQAIPNFVSFPPLGPVIVILVGIGVAEHSGLIGVALRRLVSAVPPSLLTAALVFAGAMSSLAVDAGFVVLIPLGAAVFASVGRHPLVGLAAAFAGVAGGFSANLFITAIDPLLAGLSTESARTLDPGYEVLATSNYYFMVASVFLLTTLGSWVTHRFVEPRMGRWEREHAGEVPALDVGGQTPAEKKGLRATGISLLVMVAVLLALVIPSNGLLRDPASVAANAPYYVQIQPFLASIVPILTLMFLVMGIAYGVGAGTIRSDKHVAKMAADGVAVLGGYIVIAFFAAQFINYFNWSNVGLILAISGANFLTSLSLEGIPLLIAFVLLSAFVDLFIGSASAKWAFMAPIFVPMLMLVGHSPEVTQLAYRVGDSTTNMITPLLPYFPVILAFAQRYDRRAGIGTLMSAMLPYWIVFTIGWILMMVLWLALGISIGPGAPLRYVPTGG